MCNIHDIKKFHIFSKMTCLKFKGVNIIFDASCHQNLEDLSVIKSLDSHSCNINQKMCTRKFLVTIKQSLVTRSSFVGKRA